LRNVDPSSHHQSKGANDSHSISIKDSNKQQQSATAIPVASTLDTCHGKRQNQDLTKRNVEMWEALVASCRRFAAQRATATEDCSMHMAQRVVFLSKHTPFEVISFACFLGNDQLK